MMKPTVRLKFIKRQIGKDVYRILQQQWIDDDPADESGIKYEWRDVSTDEALEENSRPDQNPE